MFLNPQRPLLRALFVSLLLHAGLLAQPSPPFQARPEVSIATIQVVVRSADPVAAVMPAAGDDPPPKRVMQPPVPEAVKEVAKERVRPPRADRPRAAPVVPPRPMSKPAPRPGPVAAPPVPSADYTAPVAAISPPPVESVREGAVAASTATPPPAAATAAGAAVVRRPISSAPAETVAINADALRQYRVSLASAARRFKRYPALARERGWEGTSEVGIAVRAGASSPAVELLASSGRAVLDDQAVDMLLQAARTTLIPEKLRQKDFELRMPVRFSLEDE